MAASRWEPSRLDPTDAVGDLAEHLRFLLDRAGLTPRQLSDDPDVPYSAAMLYRFLSGQALPPPQLLEVITRRCGGDPAGLQHIYDRARRSALTASLGRPRHARPKRRARGHWQSRLLAAGAAATIVVIALAAATVSTAGQRRSTGAGGRPAPPVATFPKPRPPADPTATPTTDPRPKTPVPDPSRRDQPPNRKPPQIGRELIQNGSFTGTINPWESDDIDADLDGNRLEADITGDEGDDPQDADVDSNSFALRAGRTYVLNFDAAADSELDIGVTVQSLDIDEPITFREIELDRAARHFTFTFEPRANTREAIVSFELGGHSNEHEFLLDNVSLRAAAE